MVMVTAGRDSGTAGQPYRLLSRPVPLSSPIPSGTCPANVPSCPAVPLPGCVSDCVSAASQRWRGPRASACQLSACATPPAASKSDEGGAADGSKSDGTGAARPAIVRRSTGGGPNPWRPGDGHHAAPHAGNISAEFGLIKSDIKHGRQTRTKWWPEARRWAQAQRAPADHSSRRRDTARLHARGDARLAG